MGWLIALVILLAIGLFPIGLQIIYNTDGLLIRAKAGPVKLPVYPEQRKNNDRNGKAKNGRRATGKATGGKYDDFLPLLKPVLGFLSEFKQKLSVKRLEMRLILAGDDPADLAIHYGQAWAALGNLIPHLERVFNIKKRNLEVECDFTSVQTLLFARLDLSLTFFQILSLGIRHGGHILKEYKLIMNQRKGGASK